MRLLGIEGGGTRTSALLVEGTDTVLASFAVGPGNLKLLNGEELAALLASIRDQLPTQPDRIGIGMAGVSSDVGITIDGKRSQLVGNGGIVNADFDVSVGEGGWTVAACRSSSAVAVSTALP